MTVNNYPLLLKHSPGLTIAVFSFCLFVPIFFSNWSALLGWDQVTDWPLKNTPLLCLEKLLGYFCRMLWVIFHYDGKTLFNYFYSIRLNLRIREYSSAQFMLPLLPASSVNTSDPVQLAAVRDHVRRIMWCALAHELFLLFSLLFSSHRSGTSSSLFHLSKDFLFRFVHF